MTSVKKITANAPHEKLEKRRSALRAPRGHVKFELDLKSTRAPR